ncbi:MAG: hypothetical protein ACI4NO_01505 [Oxalobacter sp.]
MKFFLKLIFISAALVTGIATADPMAPHRSDDGRTRFSAGNRREQPYGQHRSLMIRTGLSDQNRGYGYRSKRMSDGERYRLRNQIREAGRMDFYR